MDKKTIIKNRLKQFNKNVFFGSMVSGKQHKCSDIDLIIVNPKFEKLNFFKRGAKMYNY
ncbi:nucleotidyltransferase domain-containing protein [Candidatus Woesearchaeota archaeon]|nr:nucleotidyltransferase domain-containing protein [Candidatus Woesearchaeota archaeon]